MGAHWRSRLAGPLTGVGAILCALALPAGAGATWLPPVAASETGGTVAEPQIAVDAAGNTTVVWTSGSAPSRSVRSAFRPAGGAWESSFNRMGASFDCHDPRLAVNPAGAAALVAECEKPSPSIIAAYRPGAFWSGALEIPSSGSGEAPRVAIDANGNAAAVWAGPASTVQSAYRPVAGPWGAGAQISTAGKVALKPNLGMSPAGYAHAVWREERKEIPSDPVIEVRGARRTPGAGGAWTAPSSLTNNFSTTPVTAGEPQVDVSAGGQRIYAWTLLGTKKAMQSRISFDDNGSVSAAESIIEAGNNVEVPRVALGGDELGTAVWRSDNGGGPLIRAATTSPPSNDWSSQTTLAGPAGINFSTEPAVAADPTGAATVVWLAAGFDVTAASHPAGGAFGTPLKISNATHTGFGRPLVEMGASGDSLAVWPTGTDHISFAVDDVTPPTISFTPPVPVVAGNAVGLTAVATDVWSATTLAWDFGDGASATGSPVGHVYATAGPKTATLTATDTAGNSAQAVIPITVTSVPPAVGPDPDPRKRARVSLAAKLVAQPWKTIAKQKALKLRCRLDVSGNCVAKASVGAGVAKRLGLKVPKGRKTVALGSGSRPASAGKFTVVPVKLTRKALAAIGGATKPVAIKVMVTGSAGGYDPASLTRTLRVSP